MNTTGTANKSAPSVGVTESLRKPLYSVVNAKEAFKIEVELPGVSKAGVSIDLEEDILSVRGERSGTALDGWKALHRELSSLNYQLRLKVTTPVDVEKIVAKLEEGILKIILPIKAAAQARRIEVA
jgi:HSP20 family molecular chaperone IbpA